MKKLRSTQTFSVKASSAAKSVEIEGMANAAIVDRTREKIIPEAWKLDQYTKNNILLFNHDQNMPIGTAEVRVTDEGLAAKAKISRSNEAPIPYIRDMIKEGILKTFSVGFDPEGSLERSEDGTHDIIKSANLLELSVVSVPANQDSTFAVSKKLNELVPTWSKKSYAEAKSDVLEVKGAYVAKKINDGIEKRLADDCDFDRDEFIKALIDKGFASPEEIDEILAGNTKNVPDPLLDAIAEALGLDAGELKSADSGDEEKPKDEEKDSDKSDEEQEDKSEHEDDEEENDEAMKSSNLDATDETTENAQVSNPSMDQFKAQTTLLAQSNSLLEGIQGELRALNSNISEMIAKFGNGQEQETQETQSQEPSDTPIENNQADLDAKRQRMSKFMQKLSSIEKFLDE